MIRLEVRTLTTSSMYIKSTLYAKVFAELLVREMMS